MTPINNKIEEKYTGTLMLLKVIIVKKAKIIANTDKNSL